jgi:hypothetical protein
MKAEVVMRCRLLAAASTIALGVSGVVASDWPRFRGPNGSGIADSAVPVDFGRDKHMDWRTEVPLGRSSPIIVGDRLYVTATEGDKLVTLALDRKSGAIAWRREIDRAHTRRIYSGNSSASATPTSDGTNVYAFFGEFGLVSYGRDGGERWRLKLGPFDSFYGLSASPVLLGDTLFLVCDQNRGSFILAVDRATGRQRWRKDRPTARTEGYSTPVVFAPKDGEPQLLVSGAYRLDAYNPDTGEIVWWVGRQGIYPIATPALGNGVVFAATSGSAEPAYPAFESIRDTADKDGDGKLGQAELAPLPDYADHFGWLDADSDGFVVRAEWEARRRESVSESGLVAIAAGGRGDRSDSQLLWRYKRTYANYSTPSPIVYNNVLFIVRDGGIMTSLNPATGDAYKVGRLGALGEYFASPIAADGRLYFINADGVVTIVSAQPQWEIVATNDLGEPTQATPAVADGHLFVRTHNAVYSFSAPAK